MEISYLENRSIYDQNALDVIFILDMDMGVLCHRL